ncbi:MAG: response regulator [Gemmatimonadaceae bacterium]|nr:response regulator [Gemmatimonadaceae bacterium]
MSHADGGLRGSTILLVDDEVANLDLLEGLLESAGFTSLVRTGDARQVLPLVRQHAPDLILLDLHMPNRHGLDVLRDLRSATPAGDYRPVLVLTADVTSEVRDRALSLGARDFVTKPFDATEVLLRVENLLETRQLHVAERAARERAESATRERERLLAVVAHDLRNPLAVVSMYAETLLLQGLAPGAAASVARAAPAVSCAPGGDAADGSGEGGDDAEWGRAALSTIHANAVAMQRLVEDLLDASSIRGDGLRINRTRHRVGDAFERARAMLAPLAVSAGVTLTVAGDAGADGVTASLDRERMVQLLSNLVGNAVKFTPRGGRVAVRYLVRDATLEGEVGDTGPGIAPDDLPRLFDAFWTGVRRDGEHNRHGAGLGLWIARGIVEAHQGTLTAESVPGEGATFRFRIPLEGGD